MTGEDAVYVCVWKLKGFLGTPESGGPAPPSLLGEAWALTVGPSIVCAFRLGVIDPKRWGKLSARGDRELWS
jgi:hypothetical protein